MSKQGFLKRHRIVRSAITEDMLFFGIPAIIIFTTGLIFSALDGWVRVLLTLFGHPRSILHLPARSVAGLALFFTGFATIMVAQVTIGRHYSSTLVIREDHRLITHGIYRFVRHPIYLGVILVSVGLALMGSSVIGILIMLALVPVILNRIWLEEQLLVAEFGDNYREYRRATRKLVPFIY